MKILCLGDTHGNPLWKEIINKETFDKVVFIGDYFDSFDFTGEQQLSNYLDIIEYKKNNLDKVILLIGNHDYHYLDVDEQYSGFQQDFANQFNYVLKENLHLHQMCYKYENFIFTHAGVSNTWLKNNGYNNEEINEFINDLFKHKPLSFKFTPGRNYSNTGDDVTQSPIWIRPKSLNQDKLENYYHIIGHTYQKTLNNTYYKYIYLIDTINSSKEYLIIMNDYKLEIKK